MKHQTTNPSIRNWIAAVPVVALRVGVAAALFGALNVAAGEYRVITDREFTSSKPHTPVWSLKAMSDGGYLILGNAARNEVRLIRITKSGEIEWERTVAARPLAEYRPTFAMESDDGGFWVVGLVSEFEFTPEVDIEQIFKFDRDRFHRFRRVPFLSKFDANGKLEWRNPLGKAEVFRHSVFLCGRKTEAGLLLVGTKYHFYADQPPKGGHAIVVHPWVVKLRPNGDLIWDTALAEDGSDMISTNGIYARQCGGPFINADGSTVFGLQVSAYPTILKEGKRIVEGAGTRDKASSAYLIARLDDKGKELGRAFLRNEASGFLIEDKSSGYVAISNPVEAFKTLGIRLTRLKPDLSIQEKLNIPMSSGAFVLYGAAPGPSGGIHLIGNFASPAGSGWGIAHLSGDKLSGSRAILRESLRWNLRGYAARSQKDTAVALYGDSVVRFIAFAYEE